MRREPKTLPTKLAQDVGEAFQNRDVARDHGGDGDGRGDMPAAEVGCHIDCKAEHAAGWSAADTVQIGGQSKSCSRVQQATR